MSDLFFDIDTKGIAEAIGKKVKQIQKDLEDGAWALSHIAHASLLEEASKLNSLSELYRENIEFVEPTDYSGEKIWIIRLKEKAMWIEEGRKSGFMDELLDGKSGKVSKDGKKYAVIPFKHNENPSRQSTSARQLSAKIKEAMEEKNISWGKIETNADGSPRVGKLHTFNVETARHKGVHKTPLTYGVNVYQKKDESGQVRRDIMTFRIIHEDHEQEGLWDHPGLTGKKLMDKVHDRLDDIWEKEILPSILNKYE